MRAHTHTRTHAHTHARATHAHTHTHTYFHGAHSRSTTPRCACVLQGKLKEAAFPFVERPYHDKPQDIIVFIVGGCTYAEARAVAQFNENNPSELQARAP